MQRRTLMYIKEDAVRRFKVGDNKYVTFAPGNLQYQASSKTWRFAEHQYDYIGNAAGNTTAIASRATQSAWIDLFGWGTSGYNSKYPYMTSTIKTDYGDGKNNIAGTNYDWGVYNAIYNSKTETMDNPGTWRTLTNDEWKYLLGTSGSTRGGRTHGLVDLQYGKDNRQW